jgi:peptide/nickel transport system substrate-binding protein
MILRFVFDPNAMVANVLAGAIDVLVPPTIDLDAAVQLKQMWEGSGNVVRIEPVSRFVYGELQFRPELARPANALTNRTAREGLYRAINRQAHSEVMTHGLGPTADSWYSPNDLLRRDLESAIPQYPYDPARARQLLAEAGWTAGSDGVLVHQASGERFEVEVWSIPQTGERPATLVASDWRTIGADARVYAIPAARSDDREHQVTFPAIEMTGIFVDTTLDRFDGRDIASAANRWSGRNRAAYQNARADGLLDQLRLTIDPRQQVVLRREHVQQLMADIALMPIYWEVQPSVMAKTVKGDISPTNPGWNVFTWDKAPSP